MEATKTLHEIDEHCKELSTLTHQRCLHHMHMDVHLLKEWGKIFQPVNLVAWFIRYCKLLGVEAKATETVVKDGEWGLAREIVLTKNF